MSDSASLPKVQPKRQQSPGEEIANSVSHGLALAAAIAATPFIILHAATHGASAVVGASVFAATMVLLYVASTLYHAFPAGRAKRALRIVDHSAIFLLIAGTYTPFTLGVLRGPWGWTLLALIWSFALGGILLTALGGTRYPVLSVSLYLGMGWLVVVAARPLWLHLGAAGMSWLAAGGLAYTAGVGFFVAKRARYAHFVFHLFVAAGTACHVVAVVRYAA